MKKLHLLILLLLSCILSETANSQQYPLYVSKQNGQMTSFNGSVPKQTDKYESGNVTLQNVGPITNVVTPADMSIGPNQNKTWFGTISPNLAAAPAPGISAPASLVANYDVTYSRPVGVGSGGTVQSTYQCAESMASGQPGCAYHNGMPGSHEIINKVGTEQIDFIVYSINVSLPDTICVQRLPNANAAIGTETALTFPMTGGVCVWTALTPNVSLSNIVGNQATIQLNDTNTIGLVRVTYTIQGITYTTTAAVKSCECGCRPVMNGLTFGPLTLAFNVNPVSGQPNNGFCEYIVNNTTLNNLSLQTFVNKSATFNNVRLSFKKNCKTGELKDVNVTWNGNQDIGEIKYIAAAVKSFNLNVDMTTGKLSGSVNLQAKLEEDKNLLRNGVMVLRKGITGDFKFTYSNATTFAGSFDFLGVKDINIDIVKQNKNIAQFKNGSLTAAGDLTGDLTGLQGVKYTSNLFTVEIVDLTLNFTLSIPNLNFKTNAGNGSVKIYDIKGVQGQATLGLAFNQQNVNATLNANNFTAFTMTLSELNITAEFNYDFDMVKLDGSLKAKHNSFDVAVGIAKFKVENGVLKEFDGNAKVKYSSFEFNLQQIKYTETPSELSITAKAEINLAVQASLAVTNFKIKEDGTISVGGISGSVTKTPVSITFSATFEPNRFKGTFDANFAAAGPIKGSIDIGSMPDYNFGYLRITAGVNLPLGQSGLKISSIGGSFGFNYKLPDVPTEGNYVFSGLLGVSDVANMVEVTGEVTVQLGGDNFQLSLDGNINVLKNNTFFNAGVKVNYKLPENTIDGDVTVNLKLPSTGWILTTNNVKVGFFFGGGNWTVDGTKMGGSAFNNLVALTDGTIQMSGTMASPTNMTGKLGGNAKIGFSKSISVSKFGQSFTAAANLSMDAGINVDINQSGLSGAFNVNLAAGGSLSWSTLIGDGSMGLNASMSGAVSYSGGTVNVNGNLSVGLPFQVCVPTSVNIFSSDNWNCFSSVDFPVSASF